MLTTLTLDVLNSTEIEGEVLDKDQVHSSIARRLGLLSHDLASSSRNVDGVVEMMLDATERTLESTLSKARFWDTHRDIQDLILQHTNEGERSVNYELTDSV